MVVFGQNLSLRLQIMSGLTSRLAAMLTCEWPSRGKVRQHALLEDLYWLLRSLSFLLKTNDTHFPDQLLMADWKLSKSIINDIFLVEEAIAASRRFPGTFIPFMNKWRGVVKLMSNLLLAKE